MKQLLLSFFAITYAMCLCNVSFAQVGINQSGAMPHSSAMLDVVSNDKGLLLPRMTLSERNSIATPATGLLIFQTDNTSGFYYYNGTAWVLLGGGPAYYHAIGITDASRASGSASFAAMPEMSITFTPKSSVVYVTFTATGGMATPSITTYGQCRATFILRRNGTQVGNRFMNENIYADGVSIDYPVTSYSISYTYPVTVTPGVSTTIDIQWNGFGNGTPSLTNNPVTSNNHNRTLVIVDP